MVAIDKVLVRRLLADHMPEAAGLPIVALPGGWDNRSFRVGDRLVARLPSAERYVASLNKEVRVLPAMAAALAMPVPVPRIVAAIAAKLIFPRPWCVTEWIDGAPAHGIDAATQVTMAHDLAAFIDALQAVDPRGGPAPGAHSFGRGGPLSGYDDQMRRALARLGPRAATTAAIWARATASRFAGPPVSLHGDLHPGNLLVRDERLAAVIDWGSPRSAIRRWTCRSRGAGSATRRGVRSVRRSSPTKGYGRARQAGRRGRRRSPWRGCRRPIRASATGRRRRSTGWRRMIR